jgi:KDO2-lipid IV(A) lauroyltransferase
MVYLLVRGLAAAVNSLPVAVSTRIARVFGSFFYFFMPKRRQEALSNLGRAFKDSIPLSEKKKLARESFCNIATSVMELFRTPYMLKQASKRFEIEGTEHMDRALAKGKGVVFVVAHLGSWEYLEFLFFLRDYRCTVVVREIKNPYIYRWLQDLRQQTRIRSIDRVGSVKEVLRSLKRNELVAILIDQWAGRDGLWTDFFGEKTSTTSLPVRLAATTGAALVPGYCIRTTPGQYKIILKPEVSVDFQREDYEMETTERLNRQLEEEIRRHPSQWIWTHRRWKGIHRYRKA